MTDQQPHEQDPQDPGGSGNSGAWQPVPGGGDYDPDQTMHVSFAAQLPPEPRPGEDPLGAHGPAGTGYPFQAGQEGGYQVGAPLYGGPADGGTGGGSGVYAYPVQQPGAERPYEHGRYDPRGDLVPGGPVSGDPAGGGPAGPGDGHSSPAGGEGGPGDVPDGARPAVEQDPATTWTIPVIREEGDTDSGEFSVGAFAPSWDQAPSPAPTQSFPAGMFGQGAAAAQAAQARAAAQEAAERAREGRAPHPGPGAGPGSGQWEMPFTGPEGGDAVPWLPAHAPAADAAWSGVVDDPEGPPPAADTERPPPGQEHPADHDGSSAPTGTFSVPPFAQAPFGRGGQGVADGFPQPRPGDHDAGSAQTEHGGAGVDEQAPPGDGDGDGLAAAPRDAADTSLASLASDASDAADAAGTFGGAGGVFGPTQQPAAAPDADAGDPGEDGSPPPGPGDSQTADQGAAAPGGDGIVADGSADAPEPSAPPAPPEPVEETRSEHPLASYMLRVNGAERPVTDAWLGESLLYVLRERLGLAGAKDGCEQGECGACSVQVDGRLVASCLVPAATAAGSEVRTVEGLTVEGRRSDVQQALADSGAVQCGFCIPGMAMTVHDLLEGNHKPTDLDIRQALSGNLCRCSGYRGVVDAVRQVITDRDTGRDLDRDSDPDADREAGAADGDDHTRVPHQGGPAPTEGGQ